MNSTRVMFDVPLPPLLVGAFALAAIVVVAVFVARDARRLRGWRRVVVIGGTVLAAILVAGLLLGPRIIHTWQDPRKPTLAVLVDTSRSMRYEDTYDDSETRAWLARKLDAGRADKPIARSEIAARLLVGEDGWLSLLGKDFRLAGYRFDHVTEPVSLRRDAANVSEQGYATAIGEALQDVATSGDDGRPRAVVLISDGAWNRGEDPSESARVLGRMGIPVYAVGVGDAEPPREVVVQELKGPEKPLLGDRVELTAQIAASGMGAVRVPVTLSEGGREIETRHVVVSPTGRASEVSFSFVPDRPGLRTYTVRVPPQEDEQDPENNAAAASVDVIERKIRVLLVDREPRWEFRFIRNVFERDPAVKLDICLLRPGVGAISGPGYLERPPDDRQKLAQYDVVMIGDVAARDLGTPFLLELAGAVRERGLGMVLLAGRGGHYRELAGTAVGRILPVSPATSVTTTDRGRPYQPEPTADASRHLLTQLNENPQVNMQAWSDLPELRWAAEVGGLARGATALLVHPYRIAGSSRLPVLAAQRVGRGKVVFCGTQETWRWRKAVGDRHHFRFWAQAVRWLAQKQFTGEGDPRAQIAADRRRVDVGEPALIEVYVLGEDGFPMADADVRMQVAAPDGTTSRLAMTPAGEWGIYEARFAPQQDGKYVFRPIVGAYGNEPLESRATLTAERADLEKNFLAQDRRTLEGVARASGGTYLTPGEIERVVELLGPHTIRRMLTSEFSPCRHWAYLLALVALLGGVWLVRKRGGLA